VLLLPKVEGLAVSMGGSSAASTVVTVMTTKLFDPTFGISESSLESLSGWLV
jgi:hypothetical protein